MLRLALSVFLVLMLASPWQFAPPPVMRMKLTSSRSLETYFPIENKPVGGSGSGGKEHSVQSDDTGSSDGDPGL